MWLLHSQPFTDTSTSLLWNWQPPKCWCSSPNKLHHEVPWGMILQHNTVTPHSTCRTQVMLQPFLDHLPYCLGQWSNTWFTNSTIMRKQQILFMNGCACSSEISTNRTLKSVTNASMCLRILLNNDSSAEQNKNI